MKTMSCPKCGKWTFSADNYHEDYRCLALCGMHDKNLYTSLKWLEGEERRLQTSLDRIQKIKTIVESSTRERPNENL